MNRPSAAIALPLPSPVGRAVAAGLLLFLAAGGVNADVGCPTERQPAPPAPAIDPRTLPTEFRANRLHRAEEGISELTGAVEVRRGPQRLNADWARYDANTNEVEASGEVEFVDAGGAGVHTPRLDLNLDTRIGAADGGNYVLPDGLGRGDTTGILFEGPDRTRLKRPRFTTCPPGTEHWFLRASEVTLDTANDVGTARDARVEFFGVPLFYLPYFTFPISDKRKSGFLVPQFGYGSNVGAVLTAPYYLNLAPQYDDTLTPRWFSDRGLQLQNEFRYLGTGLEGRLHTEYLPNDQQTGTDRTAVAFQHRQTFSPAWSALVDADRVSDKDYLSDFGNRIDVTSRTQLTQNAEVNYRGANTNFTARATDYQTLDRTVAPTSLPYARLPQLVLGWRPTAAPGQPQFRLDNELTNFERDIGVTGERAQVNPALHWPLTRVFGFLNPEVGARYIAYRLQDHPTERPTVGAPYAALDGGLFFDRETVFGRRDYLHTLEPRLYYLYVPYREQGDQPIFDTGVPDLSFANLFRNNRFTGGDRIGDANQLTLALTSRVIDQADGIERLRVSLGQIRHFEDRRVNLVPGIATDDRSDLVGEVVAWLTGNWHANGTVQWNPRRDEVTRSNYFLQYQPKPDRIFNLGQRFIRDQLEQIDASTVWPVGGRWSVAARALYSQRDRQNIETYVGAHYTACCWALRFHVARRLVGKPGVGTEQRDEFFLQLELAGFGKLGETPISPLTQGLFAPLRDETRR